LAEEGLAKRQDETKRIKKKKTVVFQKAVAEESPKKCKSFVFRGAKTGDRREETWGRGQGKNKGGRKSM